MTVDSERGFGCTLDTHKGPSAAFEYQYRFHTTRAHATKLLTTTYLLTALSHYCLLLRVLRAEATSRGFTKFHLKTHWSFFGSEGREVWHSSPVSLTAQPGYLDCALLLYLFLYLCLFHLLLLQLLASSNFTLAYLLPSVFSIRLSSCMNTRYCDIYRTKSIAVNNERVGLKERNVITSYNHSCKVHCRFNTDYRTFFFLKITANGHWHCHKLHRG